MAKAARTILAFTKDRKQVDLDSDQMLRDAVDREFQILGQALVRLTHDDPGTAARISDWKGIIGFRNVVVHEYDRVKSGQTWKIVEGDLPQLLRELDSLLEEPEDPG
jgi:uncharacterized protein with HEPN domain